ncbi:MAG TPA: hypothetical protein VGB45_05600 [Abditibacterium sp.]|jgi:tetratricopeptide (TPR) repeat protein
MNRLSIPALLFAISAGGCAPNNNASDPVRGVAASIVAARAFDRAQIAITRDDDAGLARAGEDLRRAARGGSNPQLTVAFTAALTSEASRLAGEASRARKVEKARLMAQSDSKYRAALAFTPQKEPEKSLDAVTLNALGYFLADRGKTAADFERAATLTFAAYRKWPMPSGVALARVSRAVGPQDSYAWALFKSRKLAEARKQQEEVLRVVRKLAPGEITAEIPFHMAEIYRALGENEKARAEYEIAGQLTTDAQLRTQIEKGLQSLDFRQV